MMIQNTFCVLIKYPKNGRSFLKRNDNFTRYPHQLRLFRTSVKIKPEINAIEEPIFEKSFLKPVLFTIGFSTVSFVGATVWQYENMRARARTLISSPRNWIMEKIDPSNLWIQEKFGLPLAPKKGVFRQFINSWWNSMSDGEKLFVPIAFLNFLVFLGWKVPSWQGFMIRFFTSSPTKGTSIWSMFLCTFSHCNSIHLVMNMIVLNSFISSIVSALGKEQFLAFYCSGGVIASLFSHIFKVMTHQTSVSLGASGAITAIIGYICSKYPDTLLSIVFLPFIVFKAATGLKFMMGLDFTGLVVGWKLFDHAAHLGGALFGLFWCYWGNVIIWQKRGPLLEWWHKQRNPPH